MLEPILKGLVEWIYGMLIDIMTYASGELLGVMSMDLSYFEATAPIISDVVDVLIALGWALLIGNLVFQALKIIVSGIGFETEEPKILFLRTFVFSFLLLASREICDIGSSITGTVIDMLDLPEAITVNAPDESMFTLGSGARWLLVIIVGVVLMVQMVKLLFEIGERYVITSVLTFFSPLAFAMGGSKNTNDIFKGWCRMYASMLVMMIMNIVFLKLIMSAMSQMAAGGVLVWLVFVVALTRVARKIDSHIGKIGLNPAQTGNELGSRLPGLMTYVAVRSMTSLVGKSIANAKGGSGGKSGKGGSAGKGGNSGKSGSSGRYRYRKPQGFVPNNRLEGSGVNNFGGGSFYAPNTSTNTSNPTTNQGSGNTNVGGTTNSGVNQPVVHNGGPIKGGQKDTPQIRPTIPRNTSGKYSPNVNPMSSVINSPTNTQSSHKNPSVKPNSLNIPNNPKNIGKDIKPNNQTVVKQSGAVQNTPVVNTRKNGGKSVVDNNVVSKPSSNQVVTGGGYTARYAGDNSDVNISGGNTEHTKSEHFTDRSTERSYRQQNDSFRYKENKSEKSEKRINHEYKQGRYNPAAVNKKGKNTYYQKNNT